MEANYKKGFVKNILKVLDTDSALCLLGLCLTSNDIILCSGQIDKHSDEENTYFFATSLSILREVAKIISNLNNLMIKNCFSDETTLLYEKLKKELVPFQDESLTKRVLKPIRDHTFHYDYLNSEYRRELSALINETKIEDELEIRINENIESIFRHRFTFADIFRNKFVNHFLSKDLVTTVATVAVCVVSFTDSLMADLSKK